MGRTQYPGLVGVVGCYHPSSRKKETREPVRRGPPVRVHDLDEGMQPALGNSTGREAEK